VVGQGPSWKPDARKRMVRDYSGVRARLATWENPRSLIMAPFGRGDALGRAGVPWLTGAPDILPTHHFENEVRPIEPSLGFRAPQTGQFVLSCPLLARKRRLDVWLRIGRCGSSRSHHALWADGSPRRVILRPKSSPACHPARFLPPPFLYVCGVLFPSTPRRSIRGFSGCP
jgi:hypothetical protein